MTSLATVSISLLLGLAAVASAQEPGDVYLGKYISKLNSYHHQVSGEVYAVDEFTILIKDFSYDGEGTDTFFWAGSNNRPGPRGFILANEHGRTNILERYLNKDITLVLPKEKSLSDIKWLAIYDLTVQDTFGDVYIPEGFEAPQPQWLTGLSRRGHGVNSGRIRIIDSKTIEVKDFSYDGTGGEVYFWVGLGPQPSSKGVKVPDEYGYVNPLRRYDKEDVLVTLPGEMTIFDIKWLAVWNVDEKQSYGWTIIPDGLNIPPSLVEIIPMKTVFPNCEQLHKDLQIRWSTHGPSITMELAAQIAEDEYVAFGFSGSDSKTEMIGGDAVVAYIQEYLTFTEDYTLTAHSPCLKVLDKLQGVCPDEKVGGISNFQFTSRSREDGITSFQFRRDFDTKDPGDIVVSDKEDTYIIWAIGKLDSALKPTFHRLYPKHNVKINFNRRPEEVNCKAFTSVQHPKRDPWGPFHFSDIHLRKITARLGPSGGLRGYTGTTGQLSNSLAWYLHGYLVPDIYLKRGQTYKFVVEGGRNPADPVFYHPFIITDDPVGGYGQLDEEARREIRVLAGVEFTRRGKPQPTAAGRLCVWKHQETGDRRLDDDFSDFKGFRNSLLLHCDKEGEPAVLEVTPNNTWPATVFYHSYTRPNMGWQLHIVDELPVLAAGGGRIVCGLLTAALAVLALAA
ncbi:protein Skeletor, isoforms B/C-like [Pollicipes pollicipes]|uniref:protein Skeletor, isoforms B/C-like n=1 Tax=Pollicipes pollicipes TaxID=41117 RepID=UPI00188563FE|nr:protein Skeletor, isoforms B/C-like [Pollicipes pollicipes]